MLSVIGDHNFWLIVGAYWIFLAAVGAMPEPTSADTKTYHFGYKFLHTIAGNITTAFGSKVPGNANLSITTKEGSDEESV